MNHQEETFIIDDLMNELLIEVRKNLQNAGKSNIDVETFKYKDDHTCRILANRERLRKVLVHLFDNSIKCTDRGFIYFGYYLLNTDLVDFYVDDTGLGKYNDTPPDLSAVNKLLQQMDSNLKAKIKGTGSSYSFSIKSEQVELTKIT